MCSQQNPPVSIADSTLVMVAAPTVAVEGWNFCNRAGPDAKPSPRYADCLFYQGAVWLFLFTNATLMAQYSTQLSPLQLRKPCTQQTLLGLAHMATV